MATDPNADAARSTSGLIGGWATLPSTFTLELLARSGLDFVVLDLQHGGIGFEEAIRGLQLLHALEVPAYIRLSDLELPLVPRYLDHGVSGVFVATIRTPEDAARAADLCRFQPHGSRSYGGTRLGLSPDPADLHQVRPEVWAMFETAQAVENAEAIAAVPGLTGFLVGPADLALALGGVPGRGAELPAWGEAIDTALATAHAHGLQAAIYTGTGADARHWLDRGFDRVTLPDLPTLANALAAELATARATPVTDREKGRTWHV